MTSIINKADCWLNKKHTEQNRERERMVDGRHDDDRDLLFDLFTHKNIDRWQQSDEKHSD